jgi:CSLREA domain-containing protein
VATATLVFAAMPIRPAFAASISVNTTTDEYTSVGTSCSLREAIVLANNNGTSANGCTRSGAGDDDIITLQSGSTYTLSIAGSGGTSIGDLDIGNAAGTSGNLTIQASSDTPATIDANDIDRVLDVNAAGNYSLTLINIIVTNGNTTGQSTTTGGGISFAGTGTLTLINSAVTSNIAAGVSGCGGGIYNNSTATVVIIDSTISGNTCATTGSDGGGLSKSGGGTVTITDSTFSNNSTADNGGGAQFSAGTVTISNSTFANNTAGNRGGGIQAGGATVSVEFATFSGNTANDIAASGNAGGAVQASSGSITVSTSILANSTGLDCDKSSLGTLTLTNSLVEQKGDCSGTPTSTADPGLGPLTNNGGHTKTMAIGDTSPAFNAATSCGLITTDQRGFPRPQGAQCDLGAYEALATLTIRSGGANDGWILESSETSSTGGTLSSTAPALRLGDDPANKQYRAILSFNTSSLPENAVITRVMLHVRKESVIGGGNPLNLFQGFKVDIKKGAFGIPSLGLGDFNATASKAIGPFNPALSGSGWYSLNITRGKAYINSTGSTQLRLRFNLDDNNNEIANILRLYSGNATTAADRPQLIIQYYVP